MVLCSFYFKVQWLIILKGYLLVLREERKGGEGEEDMRGREGGNEENEKGR